MRHRGRPKRNQRRGSLASALPFRAAGHAAEARSRQAACSDEVMSAKGHLRVFVIATLAWACFWVLGLPSYYLQYSRATMIVVSLALLPPIVALSYMLLKRLPPSRRLITAAWLAFYFSVPLAAY